AHRAGAVHHLGYRAAARHLADVLAEIADGHAAIDRYLALVGLLLAGNHPEQRGLAGAVRTDEADLLALVERGGGFNEENLPAVLLADVVETNHVRTEEGWEEADRKGLAEGATTSSKIVPALHCQ